MNIEHVIERATRELLEDNSLRKLTIDMIVNEAEVSKTTFYRHYLDKYDLINRIFDQMFPTELNQIGKSFSFREIMFVVFDIMGKNRGFLIKTFDDYNEPGGLVQHNIKVLTKYTNILIKNQGGDINDPQIKMAVHEFVFYGNMYLKNWLIYGGENTMENIVDSIINVVPHNIHKYFI